MCGETIWGERLERQIADDSFFFCVLVLSAAYGDRPASSTELAQPSLTNRDSTNAPSPYWASQAETDSAASLPRLPSAS